MDYKALAEQMQGDFYDLVESERGTPSDQPANYMSSAGNPGARALFYQRTRGRERSPFPMKALLVMREGNEHERRAKSDLMRAGYQWFQEQQTVVDHELELRGKHDGYAQAPAWDRKFPVEIKSVEAYAFERIRKANRAGRAKDVLMDGWQRRSVVQFNGYLVKLEEPVGLFIFRARNNGDLEVVVLERDFDLWAETAAHLKIVNKAVRSGEAPDRIENAGGAVCAMCPFGHICLPDLKTERQGITFETDPLIEANLDRLEELRPAVKECKALEEWKKAYFDGRDGVSAGKYLIEGQPVKFTRKASDPVDVEYWKVKVINTQGAGAD